MSDGNGIANACSQRSGLQIPTSVCRAKLNPNEGKKGTSGAAGMLNCFIHFYFATNLIYFSEEE